MIGNELEKWVENEATTFLFKTLPLKPDQRMLFQTGQLKFSTAVPQTWAELTKLIRQSYIKGYNAIHIIKK